MSSPRSECESQDRSVTVVGGTTLGAKGEIVVVGSGLAGLGAVRALRSRGYEGRLVMIGDETRPPYDRPPLSKQYLAGTMAATDLALAAPGDGALDVEMRLGEQAVALDVPGRMVRLASGERLGGRGVVIATGARARGLPGPVATGVLTLRTLDDAAALREALQPGTRLVVVGGGFIGAEVASTGRELGVDVTVVEIGPTPLTVALGPEMGQVVAEMHADHAVRLLTGVGVTRMVVDSDGHVVGVRLSDGRVLAADLVVVGIGSVPNVGWLAGSGLDVAGGVLTDPSGATGAPGVVATGDCTRRFEPFAGELLRQEHWTNALQHPQFAAAALLGVSVPSLRPADTVPYVWSEQYDVRLQFAGHRRPGDVVSIIEGSPGEGGFVALYRRDGVPCAVLALNAPRPFARWRRELAVTVRPV